MTLPAPSISAAPTLPDLALEAEAFYALQRPWPLVARPLAALAERLGRREAELVALVAKWRAAGLVRRVGAVFDARRLGYRSCLFALRAQGEALAEAAGRICAQSGVTHAYLRGWPEGVQLGGVSARDYAAFPNLWYTLSAPAERFAQAAETLADLAPTAFPALVRYKIDVVFDPGTRERDERTEYRAQPLQPAQPLTEVRRPSPEAVAIVRRYQDDTTELAAPFREADLPQLRAWQADGTLRRFALLPRHRAGGFTANGMCCWPVQGETETLGRRLAADADVTHCYARPAAADFPFMLYAMVHKTSWEAGFESYLRLSRHLGLAPEVGRVFFSTHEYKKSSIRFFTEEV